MSRGYRSISQPKEPLQAMSKIRCSETSSCTIYLAIIFHMVPALQQIPCLVSSTRAARHMAWATRDVESPRLGVFLVSLKRSGAHHATICTTNAAALVKSREYHCPRVL